MKFLILTLTAGLLSLTAIACSDDAEDLGEVTPQVTGAATGGTPGEPILVELGEYYIRTNTAEAGPTGEFTLDLNNEGDIAHQFIVLRTELPAGELPLSETSGQVEIDSDELEVIIAQEAFEPSEGPNLAVDLPAGHYVFICNLTGHYERGMQYDFVVEAEEARSR